MLVFILYILKTYNLSIRTLLFGLVIIRARLPLPSTPSHGYRRAQPRSCQISELGEKKSIMVRENLTQRVLPG